MKFCVGKRAAVHDPRTFRLAKLLSAMLPEPPADLSNVDKVRQWGMYGNDRVGDCVLAAAAHMEKCWGALDGRRIVMPERAILSLYKELSPKDEGLVLLDVLRLWRKIGICGHKIAAFAALDLGNETHIKLALSMFGGVFVGLALPLSAQDQVGKVWDVVTVGHSKPNSWGGHGVNIAAYNPTGPVCITWKKPQQMTWAFWHAYCDEAYAALPLDWLAAPKASGIDYPALQAALSQVGQVKS